MKIQTRNSLHTYSNYSSLLRRGKRHDYFTSCLPWPQKATAVSIPLGTSATVKTSTSNLFTGNQNALQMLTAAGGATPNDKLMQVVGGTVGADATVAGATNASIYPSNLYADLSTATAATINSLRLAFQLQKLYERDARGGTRYTEIIKAHFGVVSPDARLQRPELS